MRDGRAMLPKDQTFEVLESSCFADPPAKKRGPNRETCCR